MRLTFVTRSCPHCGHTLEFFTPDWTGFGDPRRTCPRCSKSIIFENVKEWDLRGLDEKIRIALVAYIWFPARDAAGCGLIVFLLMALVPAIWGSNFDKTFGKAFGSTYGWWGFLFFFVAALIFRHRQFYQILKESKTRTRDPAYLEEMRKLESNQYRER